MPPKWRKIFDPRPPPPPPTLRGLVSRTELQTPPWVGWGWDVGCCLCFAMVGCWLCMGWNHSAMYACR